MVKVLVCGGRDFTDYSLLKEVLSDLHSEWGFTEVIQGGALGADFLGKVWAEAAEIPVKEFKADWKRFGKAAGFIRNKQMLDEGKPDLVVAFQGGKGTAMMVKLSEDAGVKTVVAYG